MSTGKRLLPEEQELEHKRAELEEKRDLLADRELEMATTQSRLIAFEQVYMEKVGRLYVELDELQTELADRRLKRFPDNYQSAAAARQARGQAEESRAEYERTNESLGPPSNQKEPSTEIKSLYRKLAKLFHPDATLDPQEKSRRSVIMAQINEAYARRDLATLQRMSDDLAISPEAISGDGIGAELIRIIRKIAQIDRRLIVLEQELTDMKNSDLFRLAEQYEESKQRGQDLLDALAVDVTRRIVETRAQIASWSSDGHDSSQRMVPKSA